LRAEAAKHALRDACPVKRREEGKRGHLLRTLIHKLCNRGMELYIRGSVSSINSNIFFIDISTSHKVYKHEG
jgi:hypothetical protein